MQIQHQADRQRRQKSDSCCLRQNWWQERKRYWWKRKFIIFLRPPELSHMMFNFYQLSHILMSPCSPHVSFCTACSRNIQLLTTWPSYRTPVFVILLSIFTLTPMPIRAHSCSLPRLSTPIRAHSCSLPRLSTPIHTYPRSLLLTPARADARISAGEWQKPRIPCITFILVNSIPNHLIN